MRGAPGILKIEVGYAGGRSTDVGYEDVSSGSTGHAESVRIVFDPKMISYRDLLLHWSEADDHVYMTGPAVEVFSGDWPE